MTFPPVYGSNTCSGISQAKPQQTHFSFQRSHLIVILGVDRVHMPHSMMDLCYKYHCTICYSEKKCEMKKFLGSARIRRAPG